MAPVILPTAEICAAAVMLLAVTFPVPPKALLTAKLSSDPTVRRLLFMTFELSVVPVSSSALELTLTPVSRLPFPTKKWHGALP